ncbi:MAG: nucleotidyltransferase domain-containing protein [Clostridia bacterium]|nr:nucleotidyltransferase domain-containing protein [Clostridia bacterium]
MENNFDMCRLEERNQKIIDAVIAKANRDCPGSVAMLGICGSFASGDFYEKSDLDLLVLTKDDAAQAVAMLFIQDDLGVGHDIYCTSWERLENDAKFEHPYLAKLLNAKIVWCPDPADLERLENLRCTVRDRLAEPLSAEDFERAAALLSKTEQCYARAMCAGTLTEIRAQAMELLYYLPDALMLLNKRYYRRGTRRLYDELQILDKRPADICELLEAVTAAGTEDTLKSALTSLLRETEAVFAAVKADIAPSKEAPSAENLAGTYEEMFSNWRNKMYLAAKTGNRMLSFTTLGCLQAMIDEIAAGLDIGTYDAVSGYDPDDLWKNAEFFDRTIEAYLTEYKKTGLTIRHYADIDAFAEDYLK